MWISLSFWLGAFPNLRLCSPIGPRIGGGPWDPKPEHTYLLTLNPIGYKLVMCPLSALGDALDTHWINDWTNTWTRMIMLLFVYMCIKHDTNEINKTAHTSSPIHHPQKGTCDPDSFLYPFFFSYRKLGWTQKHYLP